MKKFIALVIFLLLLLIPFKIANAQEDNMKIKSGNIWIGEGINIPLILNDIERLNLNTLNVPIQIDIPSTTSTEMAINQNQKLEAIELIEALNQNGIKVVLQPFVYIQNGSVGETEWNPSNIAEYFQNWEDLVINPILDDIANPYNVWAFNVVTNPKNMESYENEWSGLLQRIKNKYSGNIIMRTNWWYTSNTYTPDGKAEFEEKVNRSFWEYVDFISIDAWFEITEIPVPTVEEIKDKMLSTDVYNRQQNVMEELEYFHTQTGKKIFFGGFGFPAREYGLRNPWNVSVSDVESPEVQRNGFQAYRDMLEDKEWFKGFSVWAIGIESNSNYSYKIEEETVQVINGWYSIEEPIDGEQPIDEDEIEELLEALRNKIQEYRVEIEGLNTEVLLLRDENRQLINENNTLTNENNTLTNENLTLIDENSTLKDDNLVLNNEKTRLKSIIEAVKSLVQEE